MTDLILQVSMYAGFIWSSLTMYGFIDSVAFDRIWSISINADSDVAEKAFLRVSAFQEEISESCAHFSRMGFGWIRLFLT